MFVALYVFHIQLQHRPVLNILFVHVSSIDSGQISTD